MKKIVALFTSLVMMVSVMNVSVLADNANIVKPDIRFDFTSDAEGFIAADNVASLGVEDGKLVITSKSVSMKGALFAVKIPKINFGDGGYNVYVKAKYEVPENTTYTQTFLAAWPSSEYKGDGGATPGLVNSNWEDYQVIELKNNANKETITMPEMTGEKYAKLYFGTNNREDAPTGVAKIYIDWIVISQNDKLDATTGVLDSLTVGEEVVVLEQGGDTTETTVNAETYNSLVAGTSTSLPTCMEAAYAEGVIDVNYSTTVTNVGSYKIIDILATGLKNDTSVSRCYRVIVRHYADIPSNGSVLTFEAEDLRTSNIYNLVEENTGSFSGTGYVANYTAGTSADEVFEVCVNAPVAGTYKIDVPMVLEPNTIAGTATVSAGNNTSTLANTNVLTMKSKGANWSSARSVYVYTATIELNQGEQSVYVTMPGANNRVYLIDSISISIKHCIIPADGTVLTLEAENIKPSLGVYNLVESGSGSFSGTGYVANFTSGNSNNETMEFYVNAPEAGFYKIDVPMVLEPNTIAGTATVSVGNNISTLTKTSTLTMRSKGTGWSTARDIYVHTAMLVMEPGQQTVTLTLPGANNRVYLVDCMSLSLKYGAIPTDGAAITYEAEEINPSLGVFDLVDENSGNFSGTGYVAAYTQGSTEDVVIDFYVYAPADGIYNVTAPLTIEPISTLGVPTISVGENTTSLASTGIRTMKSKGSGWSSSRDVMKYAGTIALKKGAQKVSLTIPGGESNYRLYLLDCISFTYNPLIVSNIALNGSTFSASVTKNASFEKELTAYIAAYDSETSGRLIDVKVVPLGKEMGTEGISEEMKVSSGNIVKMFVWDEDLTPMSAVNEAEVK